MLFVLTVYSNRLKTDFKVISLHFRTKMHGRQTHLSLSEETIDKYYRITVMGASCVGKSSIIAQFLFDRFMTEYNETIEDLYRRDFDLNGAKITLDILDTAGTHEFPAMRKLAIANSDAFLLVYALDDDASFEEVRTLREQIVSEKKDKTVPIVIVGNKLDVSPEKRILEKETAESIASVEWGCGYVEASAKENINIMGIFMEMLKLCEIPCVLPPNAQVKMINRKRYSAPNVPIERLPTFSPRQHKRHSCTIS